MPLSQERHGVEIEVQPYSGTRTRTTASVYVKMKQAHCKVILVMNIHCACMQQPFIMYGAKPMQKASSEYIRKALI